MIQMWDDLFCKFPEIQAQLKDGEGDPAFELMHRVLDTVWYELYRVMKEGAIACINIGDATRTLKGRFKIYPNHCRIRMAFWEMGFDTLPTILWRKPTNAPNKFMGSGMLPAGAYVTLEHEHILIFRKGAKREFKSVSEKKRRMQSSFFWEERNRWFSDVWDLRGVRQKMGDRRSAAYPFELPYRLINMYSLYEDTVLDPFLGTGTTALAAIASGRNSIGFEIDETFLPMILDQEHEFQSTANEIIFNRIKEHKTIYEKFSGKAKYTNRPHGFPVVTRQETDIQFFKVKRIEMVNKTEITARYEPLF
jgi:DNA modification methylase